MTKTSLAAANSLLLTNLISDPIEKTSVRFKTALPRELRILGKGQSASGLRQLL